MGYGVFPCKLHGKVPATSNGLKSSTTDPATIRRLFKRPRNIGLLPPASVLVIDIDVSKDNRISLAQRRGDTRQVLRMLERNFTEIAEAPLHSTPSGGHHIFLRLSNDTPHLTTGAWPRGSRRTHGDLRGMNRAYVVAPPSSTPAGAYRALRELTPIELLPIASHHLLEYLSPQPRESIKGSGGIKRITTLRCLDRYAWAAVKGEQNQLAATLSGRHFASLKAAQRLGTLVGAGLLDYDDALDALMLSAEQNGYISKRGRSQVERTIRDGLNWGEKRPREVTP